MSLLIELTIAGCLRLDTSLLYASGGGGIREGRTTVDVSAREEVKRRSMNENVGGGFFPIDTKCLSIREEGNLKVQEINPRTPISMVKVTKGEKAVQKIKKITEMRFYPSPYTEYVINVSSPR